MLEDQGRMTKIQELANTLRSEYQTESVIADLGKENSTGFSVELDKTIERLRNVELYELGEVSKKTQCPSCSKYSFEGLLNCSCGVCLTPSPEQKRKIKSQFEILSIPYHVVQTDYSRGAKHGQIIGQRKIQSEMRKKKNNDSILLKWQNDERYRKSRTVSWMEGGKLSLPEFNCVCCHL